MGKYTLNEGLPSTGRSLISGILQKVTTSVILGGMGVQVPMLQNARSVTSESGRKAHRPCLVQVDSS